MTHNTFVTKYRRKLNFNVNVIKYFEKGIIGLCITKLSQLDCLITSKMHLASSVAYPLNKSSETYKDDRGNIGRLNQHNITGLLVCRAFLEFTLNFVTYYSQR